MAEVPEIAIVSMSTSTAPVFSVRGLTRTSDGTSSEVRNPFLHFFQTLLPFHSTMPASIGIYFLGSVALLFSSYALMRSFLGKPRRLVPPESDALFRIGHEASNSSSCLPHQFNVLVWNIEKGVEAQFGLEFDRLARGKHLVLLQEYLGEDNVDERLTSPPIRLRYDGATSFCYDSSQNHADISRAAISACQIRTGVITGAPVVPTSTAAFVTADVEPVVATPKASIATKYKIDSISSQERELELLVVNTHGLNRASFDAFETQLQHLASLVRQHVGPVLWGGDFNTNSRRKRDFLFGLTVTELGMTSVAFDPDRRTVSKLSRQPLDWVFVRGLQVVHASSIESLGSDHNPINVSLSVNLPRSLGPYRSG
jgi:endonuclease/exonuclease/phosphatase family metal-dependent hydrolase